MFKLWTKFILDAIKVHKYISKWGEKSPHNKLFKVCRLCRWRLVTTVSKTGVVVSTLAGCSISSTSKRRRWVWFLKMFSALFILCAVARFSRGVKRHPMGFSAILNDFIQRCLVSSFAAHVPDSCAVNEWLACGIPTAL